MKIQENTIIYPLPSADLLADKERKWRLQLPDDYKDFITQFNGGIPEESQYMYNYHAYNITRFLCIIKNVSESEHGWYDISVIESQIGERLTDNEDLIGVEVLPIAELFAGDYVCLDFRDNKNQPCVCIWDHEESDDFAPVTYKAADSFSEFISKLF